MPKAKWGSDMTPEDIDGAKGGDFSPYTGDIPPSGVYKFVLKSMKQSQSKAGNPLCDMVWELVPKNKEQKRFAGCPVFDHMPVMKSAAFRSKALCAAIGVSSKDFMGKTVVDDSEPPKVLKIGNKKIADARIEVFINVKKDNDADYGVRLVLNGSGYLPVPDGSDSDGGDTSNDDDDNDDDGSEPPF